MDQVIKEVQKRVKNSTVIEIIYMKCEFDLVILSITQCVLVICPSTKFNNDSIVVIDDVLIISHLVNG